MKSKKFVIYAKKKVSSNKNDKDTLKNIKPDIIVITQENLEEPLIIIAI